MTDQPSKMMQDLLAKIEQEKRERPTPPPPAQPATKPPSVPSYLTPGPRPPHQMRLVPNYLEQSKNAGEMRAKVMEKMTKECPICGGKITQQRRSGRYHCANCHVFITID